MGNLRGWQVPNELRTCIREVLEEVWKEYQAAWHLYPEATGKARFLIYDQTAAMMDFCERLGERAWQDGYETAREECGIAHDPPPSYPA